MKVPKRSMSSSCLNCSSVISSAGATGVVHKDVHAAEAVHCSLHGSLDLFGVGYVACEGQYLDAEFTTYRGGVLVEEVLAACEKHEIGSLAGISLCHLESEAGRSAGDNGNLAFKIKIILHYKMYGLYSILLKGPQRYSHIA